MTDTALVVFLLTGLSLKLKSVVMFLHTRQEGGYFKMTTIDAKSDPVEEFLAGRSQARIKLVQLSEASGLGNLTRISYWYGDRQTQIQKFTNS